MTEWQCDSVTDIAGSWDAHASKKAENQLVVLSHRSWGDAHLNLGAAQAPPN